jgi:acetylornithine deacetylase
MPSSLPSVKHLISDLIAIPSVSCTCADLDQSNLPVIECLAAWCETLGFCVEILPVEGEIGKANLIATLGKGSGGLVLAGHTDTVPYDDRRWQSDPFKMTERDGHWYGLGTSDMKSFFALALEATRLSQASKKDFQQPLILLATADEETSMSGAEALLKLGRPKARYAVIGEPTGLRPVRLHKGIFMEEIQVIGQSGHSSNPALGHSALEGMHAIMTALLAWRQRLQQQWHNPIFEVPVPTMNLGHIHGGDNPNRISAECVLQLDCRPLPGMSINALRAEMQHLAQQAVQDQGLTVSFKSLFSGLDAMETTAESELVKATEKLTGHPAEAVAFATEGPYLNALGMETIIFGAGDIEQAHQPDEFLALDRVEPMIGYLQHLIKQFCF